MKAEKTGLELLAQGASDLARALKKLEDRAMREDQIIEHLTYASYKHNRDISPEVSPARWATIYGPNSTAMEALYQKNKSYQARVLALEFEGLTTSDAQAVVDAELLKEGKGR